MKIRKKIKALIGALAFGLCSILLGVSSYAWHNDSKGNLVSDNLVNYVNVSRATNGVTYTIQDGVITLNGNATGTIFIVANGIFEAGTYTWAMFNSTINYNSNLSPLDNNLRIELRSSVSGVSVDSQLYFDTINKTKTFTISSNMSYVYIRIASGTILNNFTFKPMLVSGSNVPSSYEPYGSTYYSSSNLTNITQSSYGCFAFADSISVYYNNGSQWSLYKTYSSCYEMVMEDYVKFRNGSLSITDYTLIFVNLGGDSSWQYRIDVSFPINKVRVEYYNEWKIYGDIADITFTNYSTSSYSENGASNPRTIVLSEHDFLPNTYLKTISLTRRNPDIAIPYSQMGTPSMTNEYSIGYYDGINDGKQEGYDIGFDDGKQEGIDIGRYLGYTEADSEDFTTNGFKILIGSIFNYPINMVKSVFGFEFMGINVASIIIFVLSIAVVAFVIKKFRG